MLIEQNENISNHKSYFPTCAHIIATTLVGLIVDTIIVAPPCELILFLERLIESYESKEEQKGNEEPRY